MKNFLFKIASLAENSAANVAPTKKADGYERGYVDEGSKGNSNGYSMFRDPRHLYPYTITGGMGALIGDLLFNRGRNTRSLHRRINQGIKRPTA